MLNATFTLLVSTGAILCTQIKLKEPVRSLIDNTRTSKSLIGSKYFPFHMSILLQQRSRIGIFKLVSIHIFLVNY